MIELLYLMFGMRVEAHGKKWVVIQGLPRGTDPALDLYLAIEEDVWLPATVAVIAVPRTPTTTSTTSTTTTSPTSGDATE